MKPAIQIMSSESTPVPYFAVPYNQG